MDTQDTLDDRAAGPRRGIVFGTVALALAAGLLLGAAAKPGPEGGHRVSQEIAMASR